MSDYLSISPSIIRTGTRIGCDLFVSVKRTAGSEFVLYCRGDVVFEEVKRRALKAEKIRSLYIRKDNQKEFYEYIENNFQDIITNTNISYDEKTTFVYNTATNVVKNLFDDPRSGNIKRTKSFASNLASYIIDDSKAAESLIQIAIHEYYTYTHSVNVAAVGTLFGKYLGLGGKELRPICTGILLHDIGKTRVSTDIINKKGKLTKVEFEEVKKHPELGVKALDEAGIAADEIRLITLQHHEDYDGGGYPYGLKKDEISLYGRIVRIIDVYDAITTNRSYAGAKRPFSALKEMQERMSHCFDTELFLEFIRFLGPYDSRSSERTYGNADS
ncbi:MAG: HD-GYP domain-containing protein [Candidatus Brocadiaceae bacterium]|nr:HD-GYP domain-containing protein [Candidatus Brocadiaceae bacterium]